MCPLRKLILLCRSRAAPKRRPIQLRDFRCSCYLPTLEEIVRWPSCPSSPRRLTSRAWEWTPKLGDQMESLRELLRLGSAHERLTLSFLSIPYAPSHLLPLASLTAGQGGYVGPSRSSTLSNALTNAGGPPPIRNVIDMTFLPGFNEPTLAILYAPEPSWTGRLESVNQNCLVSLVTLASGSGVVNNSQTTAVVIATSPALPYSSLAVHPCPPDLGGTLIVTANGILHLEQGGKTVGTASNGWFGKEWSGSGALNKNDATVREELEGARVVFVANNKAIIFCKSGSTLELTLQTSGRSVSSMKLQKVGRGVAASCVERIRGSKGRFGENGYVFVGSEVGESSLIRWEIGVGGANGAAPIAIAAEPDRMDVDDDDEGELL